MTVVSVPSEYKKEKLRCVNSSSFFNVGITDFKQVIESKISFIDKTHFIKEVIDYPEKVKFIIRPRKFGKTFNLTMLQYFFGIQYGSKDLFENLAILKLEGNYKEHQGKYPVIFLSFFDVMEENYEKARANIENKISVLYSNFYDKLIDSGKLNLIEREYCENIMRKNVKTEDSLLKLTCYLHKIYKQRVIILVDEYDTPIHYGYLNKINYYQDISSFLRGILIPVLSNNSYLEKAILTGILIPKILNLQIQLNVFSMMSFPFKDAFGFTLEEVEEILPGCNIEDIKKWCGNYNIDSSILFNSWSIANIKQEIISLRTNNNLNNFKNYWIDNTNNDFIIHLINDCKKVIFDEINKLLNDYSVEVEITNQIEFEEIKENKNILLSLLFFSGYLTIEKKINSNNFLLKIPNKEIKDFFIKIVKKWMAEKEEKMKCCSIM